MLFVWAWNTIDRTILRPVESISEHCLALAIEDIRSNESIQTELKQSEAEHPNTAAPQVTTVGDRQSYLSIDGTQLIQVDNQWLPKEVFTTVDLNRGDAELNSAHDYYRRYVQLKYLKLSLIHI